MRFAKFLLVMALMLTIVTPVFAQETIVDIAAGNEDFATLVAAVTAADPSIAAALSGEGPLTVFAPTNDAFAALLAALGTTAEDLLANTELLNTVLTYHVIPGAVLAADVVGLDGQSVATLQGEEISIAVVDGAVVLNGSVNVVATDIVASNGVIHVIDAVLLPPSVVEAMAAPAEEPGMVNIRVAHFSPDTPAVDIYVNGEAAITGLEFPAITDFVTLPAGSYELAVAPAGTSIADAAIGPATFDLPEGAFLTIAAVGSLANGTLQPAIVANDFSAIAEGSARVVVFHAIEGAPAVNVLAGDAVLIEALSFPGTITSDDGAPNDGAFNLDVPAGSYDLSVVTADGAAPILDLPGTVLEAGSYYFVAAVGTPDAPQVALAVVDAATAATLRGEEMMAEMEAPTQNIVEIASANADFSTLVAAVLAADPAIAEALTGEGPLTVFAPTNEAFAALLASLNLSAEELLGNTELLTTVLMYHVVSGAVPAADVIGLDGQSAITLQGEDISIAIVDGGVVLNDSVNVITTDIYATNGVIHVIDGVLLPPSVVESLGQ